MQTTNLVWAAASILLLSAVIVFLAAWFSAPDGVEDEEGFRETVKETPKAVVSGREQMSPTP